MTAKEHFLQVEDKQLREVLLSNLEKYPNNRTLTDGSVEDYDTPERAVNAFRFYDTEQDGDMWMAVRNTKSFQPYFDKYGKSEETTNPLDESELRKKANNFFFSINGNNQISDYTFKSMLDFAKYYHSIQAKELQYKYDDLVKRADCYLEEKDKELGQLREEVMNHLEGTFIVYYDSTTPRFNSFEEAVQRAKGKNDKHLQIFKLVAEVEKVTTINVKEV
jgi:hypothetical protein